MSSPDPKLTLKVERPQKGDKPGKEIKPFGEKSVVNRQEKLSKDSNQPAPSLSSDPSDNAAKNNVQDNMEVEKVVIKKKRGRKPKVCSSLAVYIFFSYEPMKFSLAARNLLMVQYFETVVVVLLLVWPSRSALPRKSKQLPGECHRSSGLLMLWCALMRVSAEQWVIMCVRLWVLVLQYADFVDGVIYPFLVS